MGLTNHSTGKDAIDNGLFIQKQNEDDKIIALAGNPNVGKSTVFNELTGMKQHTGNWPGKTVSNVQGYCKYHDENYVMVDIPGCYSIMAQSEEEEIARDFICFGQPDTVIVVCDATCLERNLNLVLQILEITSHVVVCVNLLDEAKRKDIQVDIKKLSTLLGVPVVGTSARKGDGLDDLMAAVSLLSKQTKESSVLSVTYAKPIEDAIDMLTPYLLEKYTNKINARWLAIKLITYNQSLFKSINEFLGEDILADPTLKQTLETTSTFLNTHGIIDNVLHDSIVSSIVQNAEVIYKDTVTYKKSDYNQFDKKLDKIFTNKRTGYPLMILLLVVVFWLTIVGSNLPSQLLSDLFLWIEDKLIVFFSWIGAPKFLYEMLVHGVYRVLTWVVSVMLPPMAIFFPLFTLLEDLGYLPRIAFNMDHCFKRCCACGKQALTMCMGFGCNAAGIVGCRIIDSPRERLIAIITNNLVPCNGRFPTMIAVIAMFFITATGPFQSVIAALLLTGIILLGVFMTFIVSRILSKTILKGVPSSFTLELPPYRKPQVGKIIVRSIFDRTLFVLGRAIAVAAPAGLIIWLFANISIGDVTLLSHCAALLDPFGKLLGMDGVILLAFILGWPANEIVIPIIIMTYMATGKIVQMENVNALRDLFVNNGWTVITAACTVIFMLFHWPCSTTCLTIKKETGSKKWTFVAIIMPTVIGMLFCFIVSTISKFFM